MQQEKYIDILLKYNNREISDKEFVDFLNAEPDLQNLFNKTLKSSFLASNDVSVVERINEDFSKIGTERETFFDKEKKKSITSFFIHQFNKQLLAKKFFKYLAKSDADDFVITELTDLRMLYNADKEVEDYIRTKIIDNMPKFDKINDAVKYAKAKVKEIFTCEKSMPNWAQNCEWPFDKSGNPMKFISSKTEGEKMELLFIDTATQGKKTIVQYY